MFVCGACGRRSDHDGFCPVDGRPLTATADPLLGSELGRYRLASVIGEGGMGRVYLGVQPAIGSRVAIKVLSDRASTQQDLVERFFAEARAVNLIRHESIASVIDLAWLPDGRPYIVMEHVDGQRLGALVAGGAAPLGGVVQVMGEVLSALAAAHAIGIVHRDLKPDNILVTHEGHAKVLDFGIAKLAGLAGALSGPTPRTRTGALLGTPAYMAPEQVSGGVVDARTDVYAAGIVLFEAITGRVPFEGETLFELMKLHLEVTPAAPSRFRRELPASLDAVVATALAKQPDDRYRDGAEMANALHAAAAELPPAAWRSLVRGAPIPGGPRSLSRVTSTSQLARGSPGRGPSAHAPTVAAPAEVTTRAGAGRRARLAIAGLVAGGALTGTAAVVAIARGLDRDAPAEREGSAPAIVIGGGSAADHGVFSGPGVTRGPGVVVGARHASPPVITTELDATHFDVIAYLPQARARARTLVPDVELSEFVFYENVRRDGTVDLTRESSSTSYYEFVSPSRAKLAQHADQIGCYVVVDVDATGASARVREDATCDHPARPVPRCGLAEVWRQAGGATTASYATIGFLADGTWFFDPDHAGQMGEPTVRSFGDCP